MGLIARAGYSFTKTGGFLESKPNPNEISSTGLGALKLDFDLVA